MGLVLLDAGVPGRRREGAVSESAASQRLSSQNAMVLRWRERVLLVVQLLRQLGKKPVVVSVHLDEIDGDGDGVASFYAVDVELPLAAPLPNGIGDDGYFIIVERDERQEHLRILHEAARAPMSLKRSRR
ncbi:hypothetical protein CUJ84_Chr002819 [Rhizobium leguminosarum]|uniref:Uncharacterized protein n=1 Tax=Rhizobium leguminosarum TaxID=384 RepID=A0A2K9Z4L1_RHILE|nr:hypothetical protein CUJ84_Chr002819 [Rhizobium leguminosarum]